MSRPTPCVNAVHNRAMATTDLTPYDTQRPCRARGCRTTIRYGLYCARHRGSDAAKGDELVASELFRHGLDYDDAQLADPGRTLLTLVTQSAARCRLYADLLQEQYDAATDATVSGDDHAGYTAHGLPPAVRALIGHKYAVTRDGGVVPVEEAIRALVTLESDERERCSRFAKTALDAGVAERAIRLAEEQADILATLLRSVFDDPALALTADQRETALAVTRRHLTAVATGGDA